MHGSFGFDWGGVVIYQPTLEFINHFFRFINQLSKISTTLGNLNAIRQIPTNITPNFNGTPYHLGRRACPLSPQEISISS